VVPAPAAFSFGIQVTAALLSSTATFAVFANRLIQSCFRAFNLALASCMVVVRLRPGSGNEHHSAQSSRHNHRYWKLLEAS
jgi:hypothetical protein